jgi:hypothetical protein
MTQVPPRTLLTDSSDTRWRYAVDMQCTVAVLSAVFGASSAKCRILCQVPCCARCHVLPCCAKCHYRHFPLGTEVGRQNAHSLSHVHAVHGCLQT